MAIKMLNRDQADPKAHKIEVHVDHDGRFTYCLAGSVIPATTLKPRHGDTVSWCVTFMGVPVPFQIEFAAFNPFGRKDRVIRSLAGWTKEAKVNLSDHYTGNRVFKYTVSTTYGWS